MSYTHAADKSVLADLGERLRRARLARNLTQQRLAYEAGVGTATLRRLEAGQGASLVNVIRVLRALGLLDRLEQVIPPPAPDPIEQLESQRGMRQRARDRSL
ncbi:MAG: helix-turn-helix domain-containing protein [Actinomycetota bacterium]|nr:helix-turn-helix domain-containing protein [Actinomycetota bacterium]